MNQNAEIYRIGAYDIFLNNIIGIGSYSVVYIGKHNDPKLNNKDIAIKKILIRDVSSKVRKAISDEINIMNHIKNNPHPNIVKCYDIIDDIDTIYIIMEYCDSGDMSRIIGKPMKEENVKYYFKQLIDGIKYLNKHKIIHRDIKPKNILLTDNKKTLKICDFGLAKTVSNMTRSYTVCGSPLYMAPEMFGDKSYSETVDIWSIGILLYEMLYGLNPFYKVKDKQELEKFMISDDEEIQVPPKYCRNTEISEVCINLMKLLLQKNASIRISFDELYLHEWFNNNDNSDNTDIDSINLENECKSSSDSSELCMNIEENKIQQSEYEYEYDIEDDQMLFIIDQK